MSPTRRRGLELDLKLALTLGCLSCLVQETEAASQLDESDTLLIIFSVLGGLLFICACVGAYFCCCRSKKKNKDKNKQSQKSHKPDGGHQQSQRLLKASSRQSLLEEERSQGLLQFE